MQATEEEIIATLTLSKLQGLSQSQALTLIGRYGSACAALADKHPANQEWVVLQADSVGQRMARERAESEWRYCQEHGIEVLPVASSGYPSLLQAAAVTDRPLHLFYKGTGSLNRRHILSVVGTRHITEQGKQVCAHLMAELSQLLPDVLIVSGLAYGVDIHTHRASLANGLDTIGVLAHGLDRIYPKMHTATAKQMVQHGGLLTEYFTQTVPDRGNFVRRNRIVAGMAHATLVVESAAQGGSLITARIARDYGRPLFAVPGRVIDPYSVGCNQLIRSSQAQLVTSAQDLLSSLGWTASSPQATQPQQATLFPLLDTEQQKVVDALTGHDALTVDHLSAATSFSLTKLSDLLFDLEEMQVVKRLPGNRYRTN